MTLRVPHFVGPYTKASVTMFLILASTRPRVTILGIPHGQVPTTTLLLSPTQPQLTQASQPLLTHLTITTHIHRFNRDDGQPIGTPQDPPPLTQRYRAANAETRVGACSCELYLPNICHCWTCHATLSLLKHPHMVSAPSKCSSSRSP